MNAWLIIKADLTFSEKLRPITNDYRALLQAGSSEVYFGMVLARTQRYQPRRQRECPNARVGISNGSLLGFSGRYQGLCKGRSTFNTSRGCDYWTI